MAILNDPVPLPEDKPEPEWSPEIGLRRAAVRGPIVTVVVAVLMSPLFYFMPYVMLGALVRIGLTLLVGWIIFRAVQSAGGMTSWPLTALATVLTLIAFLLQNLVMMASPSPMFAALTPLRWWEWFTPECIFLLHLVTILSLPLCIVLFHSGSGPGGYSVLGEVLTMGVWGTRR